MYASDRGNQVEKAVTLMVMLEAEAFMLVIVTHWVLPVAQEPCLALYVYYHV